MPDSSSQGSTLNARGSTPDSPQPSSTNPEPAAAHRLCAGTTLDGRHCAGRPDGRSTYCFWHDPAGGGQRPEYVPGHPILQKLEPVQSLEALDAVLNEVAVYLATRRQIEARRVTALISVAALMFRIMELERRQAAAKARAEEIRRRPEIQWREVSAAPAASAPVAARMLREIQETLDDLTAAGVLSRRHDPDER